MRYSAALFSCVLVTLSTVTLAQAQEFAHVVRNGDKATLTVFGIRPVHAAAQKLADEFGVPVNVEDPGYNYDAPDALAPPISVGPPPLIEKPVRLESRFDLRPDGTLLDVRQLLQDLAETVNLQLPFAYRLDNDGDVFTLVATRVRDLQGRSVGVTPMLDRRVTIPLGTRTIQEHVNLLTRALEHETGVRVFCCQTAASVWGTPVVSFEADHEPARQVLQRLIRARPALSRVVDGHLVRIEPNRYYWTMRCGRSHCFINVTSTLDRR